MPTGSPTGRDMKPKEDHEATELRVQKRVADSQLPRRQSKQAATAQPQRHAIDLTPGLQLTPSAETAAALGDLDLYSMTSDQDPLSFIDFDNVCDSSQDAPRGSITTMPDSVDPAAINPPPSFPFTSPTGSFTDENMRQMIWDVAGPLMSDTPGSSSSSSGPISPGWMSPLHIAAQRGHDRIVRLLLQHNVNCNEPDSDGVTPLIHATIGGYEEVVRQLLTHGASVQKMDNQQRSAIYWAVLYRRESLLRLLVEHCGEDKAVIDRYDTTGRTPLHAAIEGGFEVGVQILLKLGASVTNRARKN